MFHAVLWPAQLALSAIFVEFPLVSCGGDAAVAGEFADDTCLQGSDHCDADAASPVRASMLLQADSRRSAVLKKSAGTAHRTKVAAKAVDPESVEERIADLEKRLDGLDGVDGHRRRSRRRRRKLAEPFLVDTCITKDGAPCIFGLDERDENGHCIPDTGEYGAFGWCYTKADKSSWGSCGESCPYFGQEKVLNKKIAAVTEKLNVLLEEVNGMPEKCCGKAPKEGAKTAPKETPKEAPKEGGKTSPKDAGKSDPIPSKNSDDKKAPKTPGKSDPLHGGEAKSKAAEELMMLLKKHGGRKRTI